MLHDRGHLEMARRHLVEGEARVARQRAIVDNLKARGHSTQLALALLASLQETLRQMRAHRDYLERCDREG